MMHPCLRAALLIGAAALSTSSAFAQEVVTSFAPFSTTPDPGVWYKNDVRTGGTADTEDLTGAGGNLENAQPLPIGAAKLTTDFTSAAKAEVGVPNQFGMPDDIFATLEVHYAYHKASTASNAGQNAFAAPSIKLSFYNPGCPTGVDCFGTLVYEPTWNQPGSEGSSVAVPVDTWTSVEIDENSGLFWWTGGFGQPNTAGGPPLMTLAQWYAAFNSDFPGSTLVMLSVGVGSFNQGQIGYFDDVQISHDFDGGFDAWYDFEPSIGPPTDKNECKRGGWRDFNNPVFKNQGQCVRFVVSKGKNKS